MADPDPIRVLVVDDEPLARQRVEDLLAHEDRAALVGTAADGAAAVEAIRSLHPDLVFLDIQMPGMTGLDVVRAVGPDAMPPTIFVTAFDQYALQGFELAALDYLVKPFDDERFEQAFARARRMIELREFGRLREKLVALLQGRSGSSSDAGPASRTGSGADHHYLERIAVETRGKVRVVPVKEVDYIVASGPYAELHVGERRYVIRESMQTLEERLDPARFMRIHRSVIVRLALVDTFYRGAGGDYEVQLKGGTRLRVSRTRREELERRLDIAP
ncbi:MAG TPA: LytTR family DNA-binding domain-containing protein [Gemmatimonadaceae bacterium]|nr:LytTR family DNA-binding domain-containing protein [Gemmatimonadaceae bacterium]